MTSVNLSPQVPTYAIGVRSDDMMYITPWEMTAVVAIAKGRYVQSAISNDMLLETALLSCEENGYDGASMREIARRLKVSHNLLPQRFGAKVNLWYAAVDHGSGQNGAAKPND
jgi:AcrR family transcriptional regulator